MENEFERMPSDVGEMVIEFDYSGQPQIFSDSHFGAGEEPGDVAIEDIDINGTGDPFNKFRESEISIRERPVRGFENNFQELIRQNNTNFAHQINSHFPSNSGDLFEDINSSNTFTSTTSSDRPVNATNFACASTLSENISKNEEVRVGNAPLSARNSASNRLEPLSVPAHDAIRASSFPPYVVIKSSQGPLIVEVVRNVSHFAQPALNVTQSFPKPSQSVEVASNSMPEEPRGNKDSVAAGQADSLVSAVALIPSSVTDLNVDSTSCSAGTSETRQKQNRKAAATHRKKVKDKEEALLARESRLMKENSELRIHIQQAEKENDILTEQCIEALLQDIDYIIPDKDAPQILLDLEQCMSKAALDQLIQDIIHLPT